MKLFCVKPDDLYWGRQYKYQIDASHKWGLPGVNCDICGNTWAMTGVIYPAVDLSNLPNEKRFRKAHVVSVAEYLTSQRYISNLFSSTLFLPPGTEFGPMVGKAWGKFGDFAWTNPWTMLMQRKTYEMLTSKGILLSPQYSTPELIYRAKSTPDLVEPQIEPMARMAKSAFTPVDTSICSFCGYDPHKLHKLIVEASSIPINLDLFRSRDHPTHIFATERFVEEIKILQLSDISFFDVIVE